METEQAPNTTRLDCVAHAVLTVLKTCASSLLGNPSPLLPMRSYKMLRLVIIHLSTFSQRSIGCCKALAPDLSL